MAENIERIKLQQLVLEHKRGSAELIAVYETLKSGTIRQPIDAEQLRRWVARQIRESV
jgi:hypothetical protein